MHLTAEQLSAVRQGLPIRILPPEIGTECVLLRADIYERQSPVDDGPLTAEERSQLLRRFGERAGWDDPEMDVYEAYRKP